MLHAWYSSRTQQIQDIPPYWLIDQLIDWHPILIHYTFCMDGYGYVDMMIKSVIYAPFCHPFYLPTHPWLLLHNEFTHRCAIDTDESWIWDTHPYDDMDDIGYKLSIHIRQYIWILVGYPYGRGHVACGLLSIYPSIRNLGCPWWLIWWIPVHVCDTNGISKSVRTHNTMVHVSFWHVCSFDMRRRGISIVVWMYTVHLHHGKLEYRNSTTQ